MWQSGYYNLLTEEKGKKIYVFEALIYFENMLLLLISRNSLQTSSLDDILEGNFTTANSFILLEDLIKWKRGFEIFLSGHYASDIENKNIAGI